MEKFFPALNIPWTAHRKHDFCHRCKRQICVDKEFPRSESTFNALAGSLNDHTA